MPPDSSELPLGNGVEDSASRGAAGAVADRRSLFWWRRGQLLLLLGAAGLVVVLWLPTFRRAGPVARISECRRNLTAIGQAVRQYATRYGAYPPAYTVDAEGRRLHSWRTLLLPYLGQEALYNQIDLSRPWHAAVHDRIRATVVPAYHCPSLERGSTRTGYLAVVTDESLLGAGRSVAVDAVARPLDGLLICVEVRATRAVHWMSPFDLTADEFLAMKDADAMSHSNSEGHYPFFYYASADGPRGVIDADSSTEERRALISATVPPESAECD